jgi:hypothetical protein
LVARASASPRTSAPSETPSAPASAGRRPPVVITDPKCGWRNPASLPVAPDRPVEPPFLARMSPPRVGATPEAQPRPRLPLLLLLAALGSLSGAAEATGAQAAGMGEASRKEEADSAISTPMIAITSPAPCAVLSAAAPVRLAFEVRADACAASPQHCCVMAGGLLQKRNRPTLNFLLLLRVFLCIDPEGKACFELGRVLVLSDPSAWRCLRDRLRTSGTSTCRQHPRQGLAIDHFSAQQKHVRKGHVGCFQSISVTRRAHLEL